MQSLPDFYRSYLDSVKHADYHIRHGDVNEMMRKLVNPKKLNQNQ